MKKFFKFVILMIIFLAVLAALSVGGNYLTEKRAIKNRPLLLATEASELFATIQKEASEWDGNPKWIEKTLDELLTNYPDSEAAGKVEAFRADYPAKLQELHDAHTKRIAKETAAREAKEKAHYDEWRAYLRKTGQGSSDKEDYWYSYFTDAEKASLYQGKVSIGDRDFMVTYLAGYYEPSTTETALGKSNQFYGSSDKCKYSYITSTEGIIDYIAY